MRMHKKCCLLIIPLTLGICIPLFSGFKSIKQEYNHGPMFYAASYSSDITDEPYYSTQNTYTFSPMNVGITPELYRGDSVKVAVIDSGINYQHEDFKLNSTSIVKGSSRSIEYNSGWYYYEYSNNPSHLNDTMGHGTNVASVIASQINSVGCAGLAPNVELYVYKVTNSDNGYEWTAINNALQYCIDNDIDVINMSFQAYEHAVEYGTSSMAASVGCSTVLTSKLNACYNAGITLVAAAGNFNTSEPSYPASNNHVISVGSLAESSTTTKAGYSNTYGIDLVAPGTVYVANIGSTNAYKKTQGTSFSAPIVTAAIALYKQKYPSATPEEIETALYESCDEISGNPSWSGNGRLNLESFLGLELDQPTSIVINNPEVVDDELELTIGDTFDIDYTVNGKGTYSHEVDFSLYIDDGTISIDEYGHITALKEGSEMVIISSKTHPSIYACINVDVSAPIEKTLSSISISGYQTIFTKGDSFTYGGTVTAHYSDSSSDVITSDATFSGYSMNTVGNQTVTVSYTYKGVTKTQTYDIYVKASRTVIETETVSGTITWSSSTATIDKSGGMTNLTASISGKTNYESNSMRLGTGNGGGTLTISSTSHLITSMKITAKYYSSNCSSSVLNVDTQSINNLTANYVDYTKSFATGKSSVVISTSSSSSRVNIQRVVVYSTTESDISESSDCLGLETFIDTYMHMDYVTNLGYCKDNEHHYYTSAKSAFNSLSEHQISLFVTNSAYSNEFARLSAWASANGESFKNDNTLSSNGYNALMNSNIIDNKIIALLVISLTITSLTLIYFAYNRKKQH